MRMLCAYASTRAHMHTHVYPCMPISIHVYVSFTVCAMRLPLYVSVFVSVFESVLVFVSVFVIV